MTEQPTIVPNVDLDALEELLAKASPRPWIYDSYSRIMSVPLMRAIDAAEDAVPSDAPEDDPRWAAIELMTEPDVARVEVRSGDEATERGAHDARLIEAAVAALPNLIGELRWHRAERKGSWLDEEDLDSLAALAATLKP